MTVKNTQSIFRNTLKARLQAGVGLFALGASLGSAVMAGDLPQGGEVVAGDIRLQYSDKRLDVHQGQHKGIINWHGGHDIGVDNTVQYHQPGASSLTLSRITNQNPTQIHGNLTANGRVFLVNPNGVLFGKTATIDVNGLVATTADIADRAFLSGDYQFSKAGAANAAIINEGSITASEGGMVALVAPTVKNSGVIRAELGKVALGGAEQFTLDFYGDSLLSFALNDEDAASVKLAVENSGAVVANGGSVYMGVDRAANVVEKVVNMDGVVQATSVREVNGEIVLDAGNGKLTVSGTVDASGKGAGQKGGSVKVSADHIKMTDGAAVDVSGANGGGDIDVRAESYIDVDHGVNLLANAMVDGDGGKVILFADDTTRFAGAIGIQGGANSGNGGFAEVSAKLALGYYGRTNGYAANGALGTLLLDPDNAFINNNPDSGNIFSVNQNINAQTLADDLEFVNAIIQANIKIEVNDLVDLSRATSTNITLGSLELQAPRINILNDMIMGMGGLELDLSGGAILDLGGTIFSDTGGGASVISMAKLTGNASTVNILDDDAMVGQGIAFANGGATVNVAAGLYVENIEFSKANLSLLGAHNGTAATDGARGSNESIINGWMKINGSGTQVDGFTFLSNGQVVPGYGGHGIVNFNNGVANSTVDNSIFDANGKYTGGVKPIGIVTASGGSSNMGFSNNLFRGLETAVYINPQAVGVLFDQNTVKDTTYGFRIISGTNIAITNNVFDNVGLGGIQLRRGWGNPAPSNMGISITGNDFRNFVPGASIAVGVYDDGINGGTLDLTNNSWNGTAFSALDRDSLFDVESVVVHAVDNPAQDWFGNGLGLAIVKANNLYADESGDIQRAIDNAQAGWTVNLANMTFAEGDINVDKSLTLRGYGYGMWGKDSIIDATGYTNGLIISGDDVTLNFLSVESASNAGVLLDDSVDGINKLTVYNSRYDGNQYGIQVATGTAVNNIHMNNAHFDGNNYGVDLREGSVGDFFAHKGSFTGNSKGLYARSGVAKLTVRESLFENNSDGIQTEGVNNVMIGNADPAKGNSFINHSSEAVHVDGGDTIHVLNNTINGISWDGIQIDNATNVVVSGNTVTSTANQDHANAIEFFNVDGLLVSGNTVTGAHTGIQAIDVHNATIGGGAAADANTATDNVIGIELGDSSDVDVQGNWLLDNGSIGLLLTGSASNINVFGNTFNGTPQYISNQVAGFDLDASNNSFYRTYPTDQYNLFDVNDLLELEDHIEHAMDNTGYGRVIITPGTWYATVNNLGIQRGIDIADNGDTVQAGAGTFREELLVDAKDLTLKGLKDGVGNLLTTVESPDLITVNSVYSSTYGVQSVPMILVANSDDVTIQDFIIDGRSKGADATGNQRFNLIAYVNSGGEITGNSLMNYDGKSGDGFGIFADAAGSAHSPREIDITNNTIDNKGWGGIFVNGNKLTANISGNTVNTHAFGFNHDQFGILAKRGVDAAISGNTLNTVGSNSTNAQLTHIEVNDAKDGVVVSGNDVNADGKDRGIHIMQTDNASVEGGNTVDNANLAIHIDGSNNSVVNGNTLTNNVNGVLVNPSSEVEVANNTISGGEVGIRFDSSEKGNAHHNLITGTTVAGVQLDGSTKGDVHHNTITVSSGSGVQLLNGSHQGKVRKNTSITGGAYGVEVVGSNKAKIHRNGVISGDTASVILSDSNKANIHHNTQIDGASVAGVVVNNSDHAHIHHNGIASTNANGGGVKVENGSDKAHIHHNTITGGNDYGVKVDDSEDAHIHHNNMYGFNGAAKGVDANNAAGIKIGHNVIDNANRAIEVTGSDGAKVETNTLTNTRWDGIYAGGSDSITISGNTLTNTRWDGIEVDDASGVIVSDNSITGGYFDTDANAIEFDSVSGATVTNNSIEQIHTGIEIHNSSNVTIGGGVHGDAVANDINNSVIGIESSASSNIYIDGNDVDMADIGVKVSGGSTVEVTDNWLQSVKNGVDVDNVVGLTVARNVMIGNTTTGIDVAGSSNVSVMHNLVNHFTTGIKLTGNSTVNASYNTVLNSIEDGIHAASNSGLVIERNYVELAGNDGIHVESSYDALIGNNTVVGASDDGIDLEDSDGVEIEFNRVRRSGDHGINVDGSRWVDIISNFVFNSGTNGIDVDGGYKADIIGNNVSLSGSDGIHVEDSHRVDIEENTIVGSDDDGVQVIASDDANIEGNRIRESGDHGVSVVFSDGVEVVENWIRQTGSDAVLSFFSDYLDVENNVITQAGRDGIALYFSDDADIKENLIYGYEDSNGANRDGIYLFYSDDADIERNLIVGLMGGMGAGRDGIHLYNSDYSDIRNNVIAGLFGDMGYGMPNIVVPQAFGFGLPPLPSFTESYGAGRDGIYVSDSRYVDVEQNLILGALGGIGAGRDGIHADNAKKIDIWQNLIVGFSGYPMPFGPVMPVGLQTLSLVQDGPVLPPVFPGAYNTIASYGAGRDGINVSGSYNADIEENVILGVGGIMMPYFPGQNNILSMLPVSPINNFSTAYGAGRDGIHVDDAKSADIRRNVIAGVGMLLFSDIFGGPQAGLLDGPQVAFIGGPSPFPFPPMVSGTAYGAGRDGIHVNDSRYVDVENNIIAGVGGLNLDMLFDGFGGGPRLGDGPSSLFASPFAFGGLGYGPQMDAYGAGRNAIYANDAKKVDIEENLIAGIFGGTGSRWSGIFVNDSESADINDNTIVGAFGGTGAGWNGIHVINSGKGSGHGSWNDDGVEITGNHIFGFFGQSTGLNGIRVVDSAGGIFGDRALIAGNMIRGTGWHGIEVIDTNGALIIENSIKRAGWDGINVRDSQGFEVSDNGIFGSRGDGVDIADSRFFTIDGNRIFGSGDNGIEIDDSGFFGIFGNTIGFSRDAGIRLSNVGFGQIGGWSAFGPAANRIFHNGVGIDGDQTFKLSITGNRFYGNDASAVDLNDGRFSLVSRNLINGTDDSDGIILTAQQFATARLNEIFNTLTAITVAGSNNVLIGANTVDTAEVGVDVDESDDVWVTNNTISNVGSGVVATNSGALEITGNTIEGADTGVDVSDTDSVNVSDNVMDEVTTGIVLDDVTTATVDSNVMTNIDYGLVASNVGSLSVTDNQMNGNSVDAITVVNSAGAIINGNIITNFVRGIVVQMSEGAEIFGNTLSEISGTAISVADSNGSTISENSMSDSTGNGMLVLRSNGVSVEGNTTDVDGIGLGAVDSDELLVSGNSFSNGVIGVQLDNSSDVDLIGNQFSNNGIGIDVSNGSSGVGIEDNTLEGGEFGLVIRDAGSEAEFIGEGNVFAGMDFYIGIFDDAMQGLVLDARDTRFGDTLASAKYGRDMTFAEVQAAELKTIDDESTFPVGDVLYNTFPSNFTALNQFDLNRNASFRENLFSFAGLTIANNVEQAQFNFDLASLDLSLLGQDTGETGETQLANLSPEELGELATAGGPGAGMGCGNGFLGYGFSVNFNSGNCQLTSDE